MITKSQLKLLWKGSKPVYKNTYIFEVDESRYALDFRNIFFCRLDENMENALESQLSDEQTSLSAPLTTDVLSALTRSGYFLSQHSDSHVPRFSYDTMNFSFAPIHDCNFACKYCYADGGKSTVDYKLYFDEKKIDKLLDYIYADKYANYQNYKFDFVSGGEPLLDFPILEYFLKSLRNMDAIHNKASTVLIVTNGTLLTSQIIERLDNYDVFLGISIDGAEYVHNRNRVYISGDGTYNDVVKGISLLRESNASSKLKDAWAMVVITPYTDNLVDVMETCINLGFKRMQMQLIRESREHPVSFKTSDIASLKESYTSLFSFILKHAKKGDFSRLKMIANDNDSFGKFFGRLLLRRPVYYRCFAGKNKVAITAGGEIYPCDSFCGNQDFVFGSIDSKEENPDIVDLFQQAHVQNRLRCSKCWARLICGGDCFYNSFLVNGNIMDPDPITCEMNRFFIEQAIHMLISLKVTDPGSITYLAKFFNLQYL